MCSSTTASRRSRSVASVMAPILPVVPPTLGRMARMARNRILDALVDHLATTQHGAFTLAQVASACDRRAAAKRAAAGEWERFTRGVYVVPDQRDLWTEAAALCLAVPTAVMGGPWAATWWHLDGLDGVGAGPGFALVPSRCGARLPALRRTDDLLAWEVRPEPGGCLSVTDPTRTLIDLGGRLDPRRLERAVESALRRGLTSGPRLRLRAEQLRRPGRQGPAQLLAVLDGRPVGGLADSEGEVLLLQLLRDSGIELPARQHQVAGFRFDLAWPWLRVAVELDGRTHRSHAQLRADDRKQNAAVLRGWTVLRFTWDRVEREPERVVAEVCAALDAARRRAVAGFS
jgi:very-short-patch-repair endonuclease